MAIEYTVGALWYPLHHLPLLQSFSFYRFQYVNASGVQLKDQIGTITYILFSLVLFYFLHFYFSIAN